MHPRLVPSSCRRIHPQASGVRETTTTTATTLAVAARGRWRSARPSPPAGPQKTMPKEKWMGRGNNSIKNCIVLVFFFFVLGSQRNFPLGCPLGGRGLSDAKFSDGGTTVGAHPDDQNIQKKLCGERQMSVGCAVASCFCTPSK